jgi:hypothetical protein
MGNGGVFVFVFGVARPQPALAKMLNSRAAGSRERTNMPQ